MTAARLELVYEGPRFRALRENLGRPRGLLVSAGAFMQSRIQQRFRDRGTPPGSWRPRRVPNIAGVIQDFHEGRPAPVPERFTDQPVLLNHGFRGGLAGSIHWDIPGGTEVVVGSDKPYAGVHNVGGESETKTMTAGFQAWLKGWLSGPGAAWRPDLRWMTLPFWTDKSTSVHVPARPFAVVLEEDARDLAELLGADVLRDLPQGGP